MQLKSFAHTALALALACGAVHAAQAAQAAGEVRGQRLAATCAGCHGTDGATRGNAVPPLAGQSRQALVASLNAFRAGTRPATIMGQIVKGYTDEQIDEIAAYFAAQRK